VTSSFDDLVREVRESLRGYGLVKDRVAFLTADLTTTALSITVDDASNIDPGVVEIGSECLFVQSVDTTTNTLTISPDGRGWMGTAAAAHTTNTRAVADPVFPTWRLERAVNDTIIGTFPTLWGVGSTTFTFNPSTATYSMPADTENVLTVTSTVIGPDKEQAAIYEYKFESKANTTQWPTGKCISLRVVPEPGQTVTVTYAKAPSELTTGQDFTASGLRETARRCVVYGALAELLTTVDATRALTDSANNLAMDGTIKVGTATQLAAQLTARYQMELNSEQQRLRLTSRPTVVWRGR